MTRNPDIEARPATTDPTAARPHTDAVAAGDEQPPTTPSAHGNQPEAGPGQQIARDMARRWLAQTGTNGGAPPRRTSAEQAEIKQLKAQIKRLRDDNEALKAATVLLAGGLEPRNN